jgi:ACS family D-galactonate transporter-like MFS transporter
MTLFFFLTGFPTYLINGKGMTMLKGGIYAAIPFLVAIVGTLIAGRLSDRMVGAGFTNKAPARCRSSSASRCRA